MGLFSNLFGGNDDFPSRQEYEDKWGQGSYNKMLADPEGEAHKHTEREMRLLDSRRNDGGSGWHDGFYY